MVIDTIPESIPRAKVLEVLEQIGIDPKWCVSLELRQKGIYAEMFVKGEGNRKIIDEAQGEVVTHKVFIEFT